MIEIKNSNVPVSPRLEKAWDKIFQHKDAKFFELPQRSELWAASTSRSQEIQKVADMTCVADALRYIGERAGESPCVVNISLGDTLGPHDGTSPVEQFIDDFVGRPGRAVVVSAGNDNDAGKHAAGNVPIAVGMDDGVRDRLRDNHSNGILVDGDPAECVQHRSARS